MTSRVILYPTLVALVAALLATACQSRKERAGTASHDERVAAPGASGAMLEGPYAARIAANLALVPDPAIDTMDSAAGAELGNDAFRDHVATFVRQVAAGGDRVACALRLPSPRPFRAVVMLFHDGAPAGLGEASDAALCVALKHATRRAIAATGNDRDAVARGRFMIDLPDHGYSMIELGGKGVELSHGVVAVRQLDRDLLRRRIDEGKAYLVRIIDIGRAGAHKYYHAPTDRFETRLHTIYTASTVFTLLKLYQLDKDESLRNVIGAASEFLLSMQSDRRDGSAGGFFYSFDMVRERPELKLVVGTTSKTLFTLLELHALDGDERYLSAARRGADWLMSMQRPDGSVRSHMRRKAGGSWRMSRKESLLYTGQVLSALSRMHGATQDPKYLEAATRTANYLAARVAEHGCYLGDDYRKPNPISSSWVILSLFDFIQVADQPDLADIVFRCADDLLGRQIDAIDDVYRHGRWQASLSSSGNGWLAEVMSELYLYCRARGMDGCERFERPILRSLRLLMQYTYGPESSFVVKNPERAAGGVFWNVGRRYVRTDSVCHAMNAYINMISLLPEGPLVELPEPPLAERLGFTGEAGASAHAAGMASEVEPTDDELADDDPTDDGDEADEDEVTEDPAQDR